VPSRPLSAGAGVVAALVLTAGAVTLLPGAAPEAAAAALVPYESCDALLEQYRSELEKTATPWGIGCGGPVPLGDATAVAVPAERVLHDGRHLYAVTGSGVVAGDLDDFTATGSVEFAR
jgi:hypothetical protein